jgi:RNA polymerase sigma-70 factor (ECF subfamily)
MAYEDDRRLFEGLVARHAAELYRFAYRLVGEAAAAEDLVQETFHQAWKGLAGLRDPAKGRAWLYTVLRRRWKRTLRSGTAARPEGAREDAALIASPLDGPELVVERREWLQHALDALDPTFRETFVLVFVAGLSCREAAGALDVPLGTVLSRLHRARQSLRSTLAQADTARRSQEGGRP